LFAILVGVGAAPVGRNRFVLDCKRDVSASGGVRLPYEARDERELTGPITAMVLEQSA
jgi:hypothetical protein